MDTYLKLWLNHVPLSVNRVLRMHWAKRHNYNAIWVDEVFAAKNEIKLWGRPEHTDVTVRIRLFYSGQVAMDEDNLVASCKPIIDALVKNGILLDDSPDHVRGVTVSQTKTRPKDTGVSIAIEPVD